MADLSLFFLGPPRLERDGAVVDVDTRKAVALIAYLALAEEQLPREVLAAFLWPELDERRAKAALRRTLSALKQAVGEQFLAISRIALGLVQNDEVQVDVHRFRHHLAAALNDDHTGGRVCDRCLAHLENAVTLYRDDFMVGFSLRDSIAFDDWHLLQSEALRRELSEALSLLVAGRSQRGEFAEALPYARRWLHLDPLREEAHRQLMRLYAWSGQRNAALSQYQSCVRLLDEELGVPPLAETSDLYRAIQAGELPTPAPTWAPEAALNGAQNLDVREPAGAGSDDDRSPGEAPAAVPLVGREEDLAWLQQQYEAIGPDGRLMALAGEAGIGKTRLAEAFLEQVTEQGAFVIAMRCYAGEVDLAYGPVAQGLRDAVETHPDGLSGLPAHWTAEVARLLPDLKQMGEAEVAPLTGLGAESRFIEGLYQAIVHLCDQTVPGCLFIDDAHWADEASLELIAFVARRLSQRRMGLLITWRSEETSDGHRLNQLLAEAKRLELGDLRSLTRLRAEDVDQLAQLLLPHLSPQWRERLYLETGGLPYFVMEYLAAISRTDVTAEERKPDLVEPPLAGSVGGIDMPSGVRTLLRARVAQISETGRQLLQTAAAIGHQFNYELLRQSSGRSEEESVDALDELMNQGLIVERAADPRWAADFGPWYDFNHHQLRDLVYEEMSLVRRRLLHRRLAAALVRQARALAQPDSMAGQIAVHLHSAGDLEEAAGYYVAAGDHARAIFANRQALTHYQAALALNHPETAYLHEGCGDLWTLLGEYQAAVSSYEAAAARREVGDQFRLGHKIGHVFQRRAEWEMADRQFAATREQWASTTEPVTMAHMLIDWSHVRYRRKQEQEAWELAQEAFALAQEGGDQALLAKTHNLLGILARNQDDLSTASHHFQQSIQLAEAARQPDIQVAALNNMAQVVSAGGDHEEARSLMEQALALCAAYGDRHRQAALHSNLADILYQMGRKEASMDQLKEAATIYAEVGREGESWQPEIWKLTEW